MYFHISRPNYNHSKSSSVKQFVKVLSSSRGVARGEPGGHVMSPYRRMSDFLRKKLAKVTPFSLP